MRDLSAYDCCDNRLQLDFNKVVLILALILLGVSSAKPVPIFFTTLHYPSTWNPIFWKKSAST